MKLFNFKQPIAFLKYKWPAMILSGLLIIASFVSMGVKGFNWGLDFTGGTEIEVGYKQSADLTVVRSALEQHGFGDAVVLYFGSSQDVSIRIAPREGVHQDDIVRQVMAALKLTQSEPVELRKVEFVGPSVGAELREQGGLAMLAALLAIMIYVALRFEWRFSVGAVVGLAHDLIITLGFFSYFQWEFNLTILAAILAMIGYSINDTVVVFDRVRENFRKMRDVSVYDTINDAVTVTFNRTVITSGSTMMVLVVLYFQGGALLEGFSLALLLGIGIGTYSSIYIATGVAELLGVSREDLLPEVIEKEGENTKPLL
ncbi:protein translocase subunit SecF [Chromatiaceae bacterium AAb-1]|nr:protein translocase subunit SecF [Chromatiaceae bacterium AAb-1]